jgi:uncharacterized protein
MKKWVESSTRREFLKLATLSSAALALRPDDALCAADDYDRHRQVRHGRHAAFFSLAPGEVAPAGWLRLYLEKQAQQLGSHLPDVSWPFSGGYWSGQETPPDTSGIGWWPWEQKGYWIDGALRCAYTIRNEALLKRALAAVDYTLGHALPDGYLGPAFARYARAESVAVDNFRWPQTVFFRALAAYAEATGDRRVATAMRRHYLADEYRAPYGGPSRDVTNIEGMLWAYERTGDELLLAMAVKAWSDFLSSVPPGDLESGDLSPERVYANTPIHAHGVTYIEKAKLPAILFMHTGNTEYLRFAVAAQERIFSHHMLIDGVPSTTEDYRGTGPLDGHETCDITDHTWSWGYLLMATGDAIWGDRIERACFNAGLGAVKKDWTAVQYFSCPNQVIATQDSCHVAFPEANKGWMAYRPNPGHDVACCGGNVHRFLPNYVIRMWMSDGEGGLAAVLYGASTVRAKVGAHGYPIEIVQETHYPFGEEIAFTIRTSTPVAFPLSLRIPAWCRDPHVVVNDDTLKLATNAKGWIRLERTFRPGDRVTLHLPMHTTVTYWPNGRAHDGVGLEHGPLVYALPVKETWASTVTPKWSTADFPEWDATPAVPWNYGIASEESGLSSQAQLQRLPVTADPWVDPPLRLIVPLKRIPGWELRADHRHPDRRQTPPLPEIDDEMYKALANAHIEQVALVPYGATHLRLTILPKA